MRKAKKLNRWDRVIKTGREGSLRVALKSNFLKKLFSEEWYFRGMEDNWWNDFTIGNLC